MKRTNSTTLLPMYTFYLCTYDAMMDTVLVVIVVVFELGFVFVTDAVVVVIVVVFV